MKLMVKIHELLDRFGVNCYESNSLLISSCPIHEGDNITAFNINIDEYNEEHYGKWFCNTHSCHEEKPGKDIISLVWLLLEKERGEVGFKEVIRFCEDFCSDVSIDEKSVIRPKKKSTLDKLIEHEKIVSNSINKNLTRAAIRQHLIIPAQYYLDPPRSFKKETLDHFDIGLCVKRKSQMFNRVVFPVYDESDQYMVGCVGRTVCGDPRKWVNQKGFNTANFLYNYGKALEHISRTETIILVEGQGDVARLYEAGVYNVVGLFGSSVSDAQEYLIQKSGASNLVIMTDNDEAGQKCAKNIKERFCYLFNIQQVVTPSNDIGDMSVEDIDEIIKPQLEGKY